MLYTFLRLIVLLTVRIFFKSSYIRNLENVPMQGPLMIAANHPSTFLDPLVVCVWLKRPVHFLTNGGVFKSRFNRWLFSKLFMVPIYRQQDSKDSKSKNQDSFAACFDLLSRGGALVIFPEGSSENERRLRKMKTGIARIALGAEEANDFKLGVKIVCAGINYTNPREFQSELFVQYDTPMEVRDYVEAYCRNPEEAIRVLTEDVGRCLEPLVVVTANEEVDRLTYRIETLYRQELKKTLELPLHETEQVFVIAQHIANAIHHYEKQDPARVDIMIAHMDEYFGLLKKHRISDQTVAEVSDNKQAATRVLRALPSLIIGFPVYLYGLLFNYLPYKLPGIVAKRATKDIVFRAPINLVMGIFTFSLFYSLYCVAVYQYSDHPWITLGFFASLPFSGFFTFNYWHYLVETLENRRLALLLARNASIRALRSRIMAELEKAKDEYMAVISQQ